MGMNLDKQMTAEIILSGKLKRSQQQKQQQQQQQQIDEYLLTAGKGGLVSP